MDAAFIVPILALITILAGILFAMKSQRDVEKARQDPNDPNSAPAADGPKPRS
ncbi:hypothetical protein SAMN05444413_103146 [Roseivivax marinus]|uniref:hypothetical protein n=1 Tax=Roseivivax marinus TaxID=1379903 RepID=UPI0008D82E8E|nr:hypothetical protein [Roseivivax marinus]SEK74509.1 hypothetical protein SAMN05444413_103146 [Roseivivax marinus]